MNVSIFQAFDIIMEKNAMLLMDSSLEGRFESEDATKLLNLASKCLQKNPEDRPDTESLISAAAPLQKLEEVKESCKKYSNFFYQIINFCVFMFRFHLIS